MKNLNIRNSLSNRWIALVLITLIAAIVYSNVYNCPFVFDDVRQITENIQIRDLSGYLSLDQLLKPRAIVNLTFALNYKFGKLNVFGYHLVNVLIHIINGFIVYFLALIIFKQLSAPPIPQSSTIQSSNHPVTSSPSHLLTFSPSHQISFISLFAALIFIAHPIQTQAVTYTVQRYASMAAMFYMASVLFYLKARIEAESSKVKAQSIKLKAERIKHEAQKINDIVRRSILSAFSFELSALYSLSILCGLLAFLSKQNTASLPVAILLVEYLFVDRTWQGWKKKIPWFAVGFTLWFLFVLYVSGFFRGGLESGRLLEDIEGLAQETKVIPRWNYLCTQFNVLIIYIRLLFLPIGQNLDYLYPFKSGFFDGYTPMAFLFLSAIFGIGIWNIRKRPIVAFAIFWFFVTLSVESSIIPISDALFEHRLYLPLFGFAMLMPYFLFGLLSKKQVAAMLIAVSMVLAFGVATYCRNMVWQEELSLWSDVVSKNPKNSSGWNNLGNALLENGKPLEAIENYKKALSLRPNHAKAWGNWGKSLSELGKPLEAIEKYEKALMIQPGYARVWVHWGADLLKIHKPDEAILKFRKAISIQADYAQAWGNLGAAYLFMGRQKQAIEALERSVGLDSDYADAWHNLGIALGRTGRSEDACLKLKKAASLDPDNSGIWLDWGYELEKMKKPVKAMQKFDSAIRIDPNDAQVWRKWGIMLLKVGKPLEAIPKFEKSVEINPNEVNALCHWGIALAMAGKPDESISKIKTALNIKPDYVDGWFNWGTALVKMKKFEDAVKKYEKALSLDPGRADIRKNLLKIKKIVKSNQNAS